jgi:hypothetical protein
MGNSPKVLLYDIETSLQPVAVFDLKYNDYINHENVLAERHLVSICWKWLGESKVHSVSLLDDPKRFAKDIHDDYHVVKTIHEVMSQADVIVAHYGDSFDKKYVDTRIIYHGLEPLPPITSVDTKKVASQRFRFNSNRLDYLGQYLKVGRKIKTEPGLWLEVMKGSRKAIKSMVTYNKQDVLLLESVFKKLIPYIANHINRELFGKTGCPRCGSSKVQSRGFHRAISRVYRRYHCQACSGWFKSATPEPTKTKYRVL